MRAQENTEDVEDVVSVIRKGKWMNNGVEMHHGRHNWDNNQRSQDFGELPSSGREALIEELREHIFWKQDIGHRGQKEGP